MSDKPKGGAFEAVTLENALKVVRPKLGEDIPVALFRLVRLVVLEDLFGHAADAQAYLAGKQLGSSLGLKNMEEFLALCEQIKIGTVSVTEDAPGHLHVDVHECVTCSGLTPVGRPLCAFEGGLIAGVVEHIQGVRVRAREVTCIGGLGDDTCGFDLVVVE